MPRCNGITGEGHQCNSFTKGTNGYCKTHHNVRSKYPDQQNEELDKSKIIKRIQKLSRNYIHRELLKRTVQELLVIAQIAFDAWVAQRAQEELDQEHEHENALLLAQMAQQAQQMAHQQMQQMFGQVQQPFGQVQQAPAVGEHRVDNLGREFVWDGLGWIWFNNQHAPAPVAPAQGVAGFVQDKQNVHRTETVEYILSMFKQLQRIPIPADQNTVADIIRECGLSGRAIITLSVFYYDPTPIYEIPNAYPKTLDAIWAFIQKHPEKAELIGRVRDELTDNIGMCAQGNLSRLCNILSGYMEGAVPPRPRHEILQERMAAIASDDAEEKVARAEMILKELDVPVTDWADWLSAF